MRVMIMLIVAVAFVQGCAVTGVQQATPAYPMIEVEPGTYEYDTSVGKRTIRIVRLTRRATTNEVIVAMHEVGLETGTYRDLAMIEKGKVDYGYLVGLREDRIYTGEFIAGRPLVYIDYINGLGEVGEACSYFPDRALWDIRARFIAIVH